MPTVDVTQISKRFGSLKAVDQVSFRVERGEIFGLLGPNGAGKTTIIRLMLDIITPDNGQVMILGGKMSEAKKNQIGYMPEERGLYQDQGLETVLSYLAKLKGMPAPEIRRRLAFYLERFDLIRFRKKKVKELSKGMQQKAQIIATLLHQPELVIVDEPFSGLDPVNTQMVKDLLRELQAQGTTILMSTHQMFQVEELCNRILLIHQGQTRLYGHLDEIRRSHSGHAVLVRTPDPLPTLREVQRVVQHNASLRLDLEPWASPQQVLQTLLAHGICLEKFEVALPSLDEIFIQVVGNGGVEKPKAGERSK